MPDDGSGIAERASAPKFPGIRGDEVREQNACSEARPRRKLKLPAAKVCLDADDCALTIKIVSSQIQTAASAAVPCQRVCDFFHSGRGRFC